MKLESQIRSSYVLWALAFLFLLSSIPAFAQAPAPSRAATVFDSMPQAKKIDQVTISPDGTRVAYIVGDELSLISLNGGPARPIAVEGKLPVRDVSWSADSKQLAFIADLPGSAPSAQVWTASTNDDSSAPAKRAELNGYVENPRFSPDGSRLAVLFIESMPRVAGPLQPMTPLAGVIDEKTYEQRLALIDLSKNDLSTNAPAQVSPADLYIYEYDWTPDGKYVAFIEGLMSDEGSTGGDVYVVPIAGGTARNLTPNFKGSPSSLAWTEPGSITFLENVDGQSGFGQVNLKGAVRALWT